MWLRELDAAVFHLINRGCANGALDFVMPLITAMGSFEFLVVAALVYLLSKRKERVLVGILLLAALSLSWCVVGGLKHFFARPRPFVQFHDVRLLTTASGFAFPSGHTTFAFMVATIMSSISGRRAAVLLFATASLVGLSRIYLGAHFPLDVAAGVVVGVLMGLFWIGVGRKFNRICQQASPSGTIPSR